jgi:dephospho-CoA kinase
MAAGLWRLGLTGGIASGKSTAATRFVELGVPVIDADESARRVVTPGSPGLAAVVELFGAPILLPTGELDRRQLRDIVFTDPTRRRELEAILHPLIRADMEAKAATAVGPYVVMAIPLLVEAQDKARVNRLLVVDAGEALQLERLMQRDGGSSEQACAILAAQAGRERRLAVADDVLHNSGSVADLRQGVDELHRRYLVLSGAAPSLMKLT